MLIDFADLVLIDIDLDGGGDDARRVEAEQQQAGDDARLVAEHGPAKMDEAVEGEEAADADGDQEEPGGHRRPHPRPDRSQVRVVLRVEVLQPLDGLTHLDVTHARAQHLEDEDHERGDRLDDAVREVQRLRRLVVAPVESLLRSSDTLLVIGADIAMTVVMYVCMWVCKSRQNENS